MKNGTFGRKMLVAAALAVMLITPVALAEGQGSALLEPGSLRLAQAVAVPEAVRSNAAPGDDVEATNAALATNPPPPLAGANTKASSSRVRLLGASNSGNAKTYEYPATGDLRTWTSQSDITLYFTVTEKFTKIESATISLMAYDVDYPVATENDVTYLNGNPLGWMLQGGNESWHANNIPVRPELIELPETFGGSAVNTFFVDVDVLGEYWVTCISEATLTIKGQVGLDVDASDGTETGGILVTWSAVAGVSSYHITRCAVKGGQEKDLGTVNGTEYMDEDEELEPNEEYNYIVRAVSSSSPTRGLLGASADGIEGSDKGYYDDNPPEITAMESAPLFLSGVAEPVYNIKLTWNEYENEIWEVKSVKFEFDPVEGGKAKSMKDVTWSGLVGMSRAQLSEEVDLAQHGLSFGEGAHGKYKVKITWEAQDKKNKKPPKYKDGKKPEIEFDNGCNVYFEKWEGDTSNPNWWKFWKEDGAVTHYKGFEYFPSMEKGKAGEHILEPDHFTMSHIGGFSIPLLDGSQYYLPRFTYLKDKEMPSSVMRVGPEAPTRSSKLTTGTDNKVGADAEGVAALGVVIAHELSHKDTFDDLYSGRFFLEKYYLLDLIDEQKITLSLNSFNWSSEYRAKIENYLEDVRRIKANPSELLSFDEDDDGVRDAREDQFQTKHTGFTLGFDITLKDSYAVASPKLPQDTSEWRAKATEKQIKELDAAIENFKKYADIGDNEFIARSEEEKGLNYAETTKDWAFPGNGVCSGHMGDTKDDWASVADTEKTKLQRVGGAGGGSSAKSSRALRGAPKGAMCEDLRDCGSVIVADWTSESEDYIDTLEMLGAEAGDAKGEGGNGFNELSFTLNVSNRMDRSGYFSFTGYLVDDEGKGVAKAYAGATLEPGLGQVTLRFAGQYIYSSHRNGYALKLVSAANADTDILSGACAKNDVAVTSRRFVYSEFVHDAVEVGAGISDMLDGRDLKITVPLELDGSGEYVAEATILDEGGNFVAATKASFSAGADNVVLSFSGDDIYASAREGKFHIYSIIVKGSSGVTVKRVWDAYETAAYARSQFAPGELPVVVDESSFTCAATYLADDVTIDALKMSFKVANSSGEAIDYRVEANVIGTNDLFAAACSVYVTLEPGVNEITLKVDAARLKENGVEGPYSVRDVLLTPIDETGNTERFFPVMEAVEAPMGSLADATFTVGDASVWTDETGDYLCAIAVPVTVGRPVTLTLSVMLVDSAGKIAAMGQTVKQYISGREDVLEYRFSAEDVLSSELKGPYTIRFAQVSCDIDGEDPVRIKVPEEGKIIERQYTRYVDCNAVGGNGYSWSTAFSTIQNAVDAADDGDVILVADGVYAPFDTRNKLIEVKSVNGYERTFVDGGGAARCATLGFEESQTNSALTGFTLLNGDASTSDVLVLWNCGGGVCCGTVRNCWIGGCTASKGGGAYYGDLEGCVIAGNEADTYGGGSYYGTRVNCTIVGNEASYGGSGTYYGNTFNSIVLGNTSYSAEDNYSGGVFAYSLTAPYIAGNGNVSGEVDFRDALKGDYSLTRHSVCVNAGSVDYVTQEFDIAGNRRIAGGTVDIGAFELKCSEYKAGFCDFVWDCIDASEGDVVKVSVFGGLDDSSCFVQLYLTFNSAVMADVNLAKGKVNGVMPSGGLKFPLTISWAPGETGEKVVEIPVIADTAFEGEEFFTLQLADPLGMQLGEYRDCTVTIHDKNTKATLADGIANQSLKPATSGAGKWYVVESWMAVPAETERPMFVQSPDLLSGKTSTLSFGSVKGAGDYYFDMKFLGETGTGASYVEVYDGKSKLGTLSRSDNGDGWNSWHVAVSGTVNHNISIVFTQGSDRDSHVRVANVVWIPSSASSYSVINISTSPEGAGVVSGAGTYAYGTKINFNATPRPGYTFVGWYRTNGNLFGSKAKMSVTMTGSADFIALFRKDPYVRGLADPANAGKVSGSGPCASGKKVTLKATANKGYVFEGWYDERDLRLTQAASLVVDNSAKPAKPSATTYVVSNIVSDVTYYARFVTVAEDKANISCTMGGLSFPEGDAPTINVTAPCGVYANWPILTAGLSQTSAKVAGLPTGLKFNTKTGAIEGAPSAPSKIDAKTGKLVPSAVKITVTTAGKSTKVFQVNLTVTAIPDAVVGSFSGFVSPYDDEEKMFYRLLSPASFTFATTSAGKITAKAVSPKGSVSFSANYWDEIDNGLYFVLMTARTGEMLLLYVEGAPQYWNGSNHASGYIKGGSYGSAWLYVEAQRSSFLKSGKDYEHPAAIALAKSMQGTYKFNATYSGDGKYELVQSTDKAATLSVAIKNTGAVALSGTLPGTSYRVSGSSVLRVYPSTDEADVFVCGASGKTVNVMVILSAKLGDDGKTVLTGSAYVNMVK